MAEKKIEKTFKQKYFFRWYFKEAERKRSESAAPTSRFRVEDENLEVSMRSLLDPDLQVQGRG